jgi:hypothetical protein
MTCYRPQFVYAPPPFRDVEEIQFSYSFDATNTPGLANNVAANNQVLNIPLQFQTDSVFMARGVRVSAVNLGIQFRDAFGRILSDSFVAVNLSYQASGLPTGGTAGGLLVEFEPELLITPGGIILVNLQNQTNAPIAPPEISFYGPKRWRE